jgi:short-subunit dehydrogenase
MDFAGKRVLLTGAAGGLGEITAHAFADAGATLILSSRNEQKLGELAEALSGGPHEIVAADLLQPGAAQDVVDRAGHVDIYIANAGTPGGLSADEVTTEIIADVTRINFEAPIQMVHALLPQMQERGDGQLVLISSMAGKFSLPERVMYSSTKAGLRSFGWSLRPELFRQGIAVSVVTPGFIGEVGMFARRGGKAPPLAGVVGPQQYTKTLLDGIAKRKGEIPVAGWTLRTLAQAAVLMPGVFERMFRGETFRRKPVNE